MHALIVASPPSRLQRKIASTGKGILGEKRRRLLARCFSALSGSCHSSSGRCGLRSFASSRREAHQPLLSLLPTAVCPVCPAPPHARPAAPLLCAAMDESNATCGKRLESVGLENTVENRQAYRELLVSTPGLGQYISGACAHRRQMPARGLAQRLL